MEKPIKLELTFSEFNDVVIALKYYERTWKDSPETVDILQRLRVKIEEQGYQSTKENA